VGGLPTHLPPDFPTGDADRPLLFLAQFYCDGTRLRLDGALCLQVYQDIPDGDPIPVIVRVPHGAELNSAGLGIPDPEVVPHDIEWEYREDPDEAPDWKDDLAASKIGGLCYFSHAIDSGERLLLFLDEDPANFNFGGDELMLAINEAGEIRVTCA
jgi:hypothetical protein